MFSGFRIAMLKANQKFIRHRNQTTIRECRIVIFCRWYLLFNLAEIHRVSMVFQSFIKGSQRVGKGFRSKKRMCHVSD